MKIDLTAAWLVAGMSDGGDLTTKSSGTTWGDPAPTLADMLATCDALKPSGPAGYAVHPADVERLRRYFPRTQYDGDSALVNGGRFLFGLEIVTDDRVEIGRPEPLTAAEIRARPTR